MRATTSEQSRRILVRGASGELLPDALLHVLRDERVTAGWLQGSGVLADVELRVFDAAVGGLGATRQIAGVVQALTVEGSVGVTQGEPSVALRALIARETDRGLETLAGEIVAARIVGFEGLVTTLEDIGVGRVLDRAAGVTLVEGDPAGARTDAGRDARPPPEASAPRRDRDASPAPARAAAEPPSAWADAVRASSEVERAPSPRGAGGGGAPIPPRPVRASQDGDDGAFPESGDVVEHFAFGRCEVLKSDGDRLHLKVGKDGRIREIALEMLKVTELDSNGPHRRFKLDRKL